MAQSLSKPLSQCSMHARVNERRDVTAKPSDLFDQRRRDIGILLRRRKKEGLDIWRHAPIHPSELKLVLEVRDRAQPAHDDMNPSRAGKIDQQAREGQNLHIGHPRTDRARQGDSLIGRKGRVFRAISRDRNQDAITEPRGSSDQVAMAIGDGVERSRIDDTLQAARPCARIPVAGRIAESAPERRVRSGVRSEGYLATAPACASA